MATNDALVRTILPSGEDVSTTPEELLRYLSPDGLRQMLRQERLRWKLKTNKDVDYYDNTTLFKFTGELHNEGYYQKMEIRTFPDNGAYGGYAGVNVDSGVSGIVHNLDKWDDAMSDESKDKIAGRVMIGAMAKVAGKPGYGLDDDNHPSDHTENKSAMMVADAYDGRIYAMTSDNPHYMNNESRPDPLPGRTVARMIDIPTRATQLKNDIGYITDPDYHHTENNYDNSNRFVLENIDDRTFVFPEVSKDVDGNYIKNIRYGLNGAEVYDESDIPGAKNTQPDPNRTRGTEAVSSYNKNTDFSGENTPDGFLHGVFRSLEELEKVDLLRQRQNPNDANTPGARRSYNYYHEDGVWSSNWYDKTQQESYRGNPINPANMEIHVDGEEPNPYKAIDKHEYFDRSNLYQWRYNRVDVEYPSEFITISIVESGHGYTVGDELRWVFGDDSFVFKVTSVGANGQILEGQFIPETHNVYDHNPSTYGVGIEFGNISSAGTGAKLAIDAKAVVTTYATQIKNNLYAYVDVTPTVPSDNTSMWSDNKPVDSQGGKIVIRSTAAGIAYSGINSGRGGESPSPMTSDSPFYEHGGNATAGAHVHLFRYVIETQNPTYQMVDGVQVYTGKWVDQGPIGLERAADVKSLYLCNFDTNNFNDFYKFMLDILIDTVNRDPNGIASNNPNALSNVYWHIDQVDPAPDRRFTMQTIDPNTGEIKSIDVTDKVIYVNAATGCWFCYNTCIASDHEYAYGMRAPGWFPVAGAVSR